MLWVSLVCAGCMDHGELFGLKTTSKKCGGHMAWCPCKCMTSDWAPLLCHRRIHGNTFYDDTRVSRVSWCSLINGHIFQVAVTPGQFDLHDRAARYYVRPPDLAWFTLSEWPCWMASPLSIPNSGISPPGFPYSFHILWHCHSDKATPRFLQTIFIFLAWLSAELSYLAMLFILLLTCTAGSMGQFKNR